MAVSRKNNAASKGMDDDAIRAMVSRINASKAVSDEKRGEVGSAFKEVEDRGEHRKALKDAMKLANMEPEQQSAYLAKFRRYCDILGVGAQEELFPENATSDQRVDAPEPDLELDPVAAILSSEEARVVLAQALDGKIHKLGASLRLIEMGVPAERADRWLEESGVKDHQAEPRRRRRASNDSAAAAAAE
jgi:hypothetical protein